MTAQTQRMPALFIGHGTPMNALETNRYSEAWQRVARAVPTPKAILVVSAHWYTHGTSVTVMEQPRTIHDFGGFPQALFEVQYPAVGAPWLAERVRDLLVPVAVHLDREWGLDHGAWSTLVHMFPKADVPVVQLSIDATQPAAFHYEIGKRLSPLRDEGVLILGSGNVVHNLRLLQRGVDAPAFEWATTFNDQIKQLLVDANHEPLVNYEALGDAARLSIPTPEHYLPMLYVIGLRSVGDPLSIITDGIDLGSISMLSFAVGGDL